MNNRKIYFGAGPARLPETVLAAAAAAVVSYNDTGLSILEIPHRGKAFESILEESKVLVKELCGIGDDYEVLWLQGGGRHQFAMIPMNFLGTENTAGYIDSGHWSADALGTARYYGQVNVLASSKADQYRHLPEWPATINKDLAYVHFTTNNTIYGTQWPAIPDSDIPLFADMSSDIFSVQRDYTKCALFYAVVQKNIGASGATLVVVRKDMLHRIKRNLPDSLNYAAQAKAKSLLNTPPVFSIYSSLLMLRWIRNKGMAVIEQENREKAAMVYQSLEKTTAFKLIVAPESRSLMNVVFRGKNAEIEERFRHQCREAGIEGIEGHRSVGGFRASLYNAVTIEDTRQLVRIIADFE